ncbi:MAG TPA: insulinase family protein, partial [candidate division Zixibacteria bacterium]|nr:insulinase family protein [candidate division Zixibacteria bacterium]
RAAFELPPPAPPRAERKIYLVDRPGSVQTTLMAGNIAVDRRSDDYIPLLVMNQIIGGGPAGRLFLNLREEKGYTYGAYSSLAALEYPGPWSVAADVRTEVTGGALGEILKEIERMREARVSEAELAAAKRTLTAGFALALEQPARVLGFAVARHLYGLPEDYWERYPELIAAVTADDVQRVARRYLDPNALQVVAVGDGEKIKEVLEKFGPVEVYDSNGSRTR